MNLWRRAAGVIKDQGSIWLASLSRRTGYRNPDIEAAVIKSTSHNEFEVNYRNTRRVFAWVRVSPAYLKPLIWAISMRMEKTRSWVVALKGLMLMHGVFCCRVPAVQRIGRLPFDLSSFKDGHSKGGEKWGHDHFVRAYYSFLARKSSFLYTHAEAEYKGQLRKVGADRRTSTLMMQHLVCLEEMQDLLDMLMEIKPKVHTMVGTLILEAMDCVLIEIYDVYSRICGGISTILTEIYSCDKVEASMGLKILHKINSQGRELRLYIEFCREIGVNNAANSPRVKQIAEDDLRMLEHIINGVPHRIDDRTSSSMGTLKSHIFMVNDEKELVSHNLQTKVTEQWEVFEDHSDMLS